MGASRPQLKLLGAFQLVAAGNENIPIPTRKGKGLLAYLAFHLKQPQERAKLASLFWEDSDEEQSRESLRQNLALLRKAVPVPSTQWLVSQGDILAFEPSSMDIDVHEFLYHAASSDQKRLRTAADLYRGEFLEGFKIQSSSFESWLSATRQHLNEKALSCFSKLLTGQANGLDNDQGIAAAARILQLDPLREDVHRRLMELYCKQGRYNSALRQYEACAEALSRELGVEPDAATKSLCREIRARRNSSQLKTPPQGNEKQTQKQKYRGFARRQLTVFSCDISGLDEHLDCADPERLLVAAQLCFVTCQEVVARFGGLMGIFSGNGFTAYFGYPAANEHSLERAVQAGLALIKEIANDDAGFGFPLQARVGIASGAAVTGDFDAGNNQTVQAFVGETTKQAALAQAAAAPETILITDAVRRRLGRLFHYKAVPAAALQPTTSGLWRVIGENHGFDRFAALRNEKLTPFAGRDHELDDLVGVWRSAESGEGRIELIEGEAGLGKSRLVGRFKEQITGETYLSLHYQCSPFHKNTPLYPFIRQIEHEAGIEAVDGQEERRGKLAIMLGKMLPRPELVQAEFERLLRLEAQPQPSAATPTPAQQMRKTLTTLLTLIVSLSRSRPLLIVIEDTHWIDPTSAELLDLLAERVRDLPILVIITCRQGFDPPWLALDHVRVMALPCLGMAEARQIVDSISGDALLPSGIVEQIVTRADGVPLFVEELARVAIEERRAIRTGVEGSSPPYWLIPSSLEESLLARLDNLGTGKEIAQIAAVIGREFSLEVLSHVAERPPKQLETDLSKLWAAGLVVRSGAAFAFKHALVQDAAYQSLTKRRREEIHAALARHFAAADGDQRPEVLARHFSEAGFIRDALPYWFKSARQAAERSANREALGHINQALRLLGKLSAAAEAELQDWELRFEALKGSCLMLLDGYGSDQSRTAYNRARQLICGGTRVSDKLEVLCGLWNVSLHRGKVREALTFAKEIHAIAQASGVGLVSAKAAIGQTLCTLGEFDSSVGYMQEIAEHYRGAVVPERGLFSVDDSVLALTYLSRAWWSLGYLDRSAKAAEEALAIAQRGSNAVNMAIALLGRLFLASHGAGIMEAIDRAEETIAYCQEQELYLFEQWSRFNHGALLARQGNLAAGIAAMEKAIDAAETQKSRHTRPFQLACVGAAHAKLGNIPKALSILEEAIAMARKSGEQQSQAAMHRMRAEVYFAVERREQADIEIGEALRLARHQRAKLEELRAALTKARQKKDTREAPTARRELEVAYTWFQEGLQRPDLVAVRVFLDETG